MRAASRGTERVERGRSVISSRPSLTSFAVSLVGLAVYGLVSPERRLLYDAAVLWDSRRKFQGPFGILGYDHPLRGYSLPLIFRWWSDTAGHLMSESTSIYVLNALVVSAFLCFLVPRLARSISPATTISIPRLLLLNLLFWLSWQHDYFQSLSDIPALVLLAGGVLLMIISRRWWTTVAAGLCLGLAMNMRPAYFAAAIAALVLVPLVRRGWRSVGVAAALVLAGMAIPIVPQIAVNEHAFHKFSIQPISSGNLLNFLAHGAEVERYDSASYGLVRPIAPAIEFPNASAERTLGRREAFDDFQQYFSYLRDHPVLAGGVYVRHVTSGLDTRYHGTYVESLETNPLETYLNLLVMVVALLFIALRLVKRRSWTSRSPTTYFVLVLAATLVPSVLAAIEVRFLLPIQLTLTASACLCVRRQDLPSSTGARVAVLGSAAVTAALWLALANSTIDKLTYVR